jgi:3-oxoadipate enol-lactonase
MRDGEAPDVAHAPNSYGDHHEHVASHTGGGIVMNTRNRIDSTIDRQPPTLPPGRPVRLPGRGDTFVREASGPVGAPTVVLLHGWTATADLNWHHSFDTLARHYRVIAVDHRGHGRGLRTAGTFSLTECADDVAALITVLGLERVILAGYSMGGPIAQLTWFRHRHLIAGVVLCATAPFFNETAHDHALFSMLDRLASMATHRSLRGAVRTVLQGLAAAKARTRVPGAWALGQLARHDWLAVLEAGRELGRFDSRSWLGSVDVPTAVVATLEDEVVPIERQMAMVTTLEGASVHPIDAGHAACYRPDVFVPALIAACRSVADRCERPAGALRAVAA